MVTNQKIFDLIQSSVERRCGAEKKIVYRIAYIMPDGTMKYLKINNKSCWQGIGGAKLAFQAEFERWFACEYNPINFYSSSKEYREAASKFWKEFWAKNIVELIPS